MSVALLNLRCLNISHTEITKSDAFNVPNLIILNFSRRLPDPFSTSNILETIKRSQGVSTLRELNVSSSFIQLYELWNRHKKESFFEGFTNLTVLDLHGNNLRTLPRKIFFKLSLLRELYLGSCNIFQIDPNAFKGLHSLFKLSIEDNNLVSLPAFLFSSTWNLTALHIHMNGLTYLPGNFFANTHMLTNLTLGRNEFTSLNVTTFRPIMATIRFIDISENPYECLCDFQMDGYVA